MAELYGLNALPSGDLVGLVQGHPQLYGKTVSKRTKKGTMMRRKCKKR